jgi:hypothetical protein
VFVIDYTLKEKRSSVFNLASRITLSQLNECTGVCKNETMDRGVFGVYCAASSWLGWPSGF